MVILDSAKLAGPTRQGEKRRGRPRKDYQWSSGCIPLDFLETLDYRTSGLGRESLNSYADLVSWGKAMGLIVGDAAERLTKEAAANPLESAKVLKRALAFREGAYRVFASIAEGSRPSEAELAVLTSGLRDAVINSSITQTTDGFTLGWPGTDRSLEGILWPVVWSTFELLTSKELARVRRCAAPECGSVFVDTSKNHSRRWCDMKICGNRAKVAKHQLRARAPAD